MSKFYYFQPSRCNGKQNAMEQRLKEYLNNNDKVVFVRHDIVKELSSYELPINKNITDYENDAMRYQLEYLAKFNASDRKGNKNE